jgi:transcriptional regulator GlxA family with amidase domain
MQVLTSLLGNLYDCEILHLECKGEGILTLTIHSKDLPKLPGSAQAVSELMRPRAHPSSEPPSQPHDERNALLRTELQRAVTYIQDHLESGLSLQDIADAAGLSACYVARLFKQSIGQTPHQYILNQRVEKAKALLKQGNLSLAEIAVTVGFYDQAHFTNYFKRLTGTTPKVALRRSHEFEAIA